jgi:hypothetical protein
MSSSTDISRLVLGRSVELLLDVDSVAGFMACAHQAERMRVLHAASRYSGQWAHGKQSVVHCCGGTRVAKRNVLDRDVVGVQALGTGSYVTRSIQSIDAAVRWMPRDTYQKWTPTWSLTLHACMVFRNSSLENC